MTIASSGPAVAATAAGGSIEHSRALTEPVLRAAIGRLDPWIATMSGYHLGWCDADGVPTDGVPTDGGPGKAIRPTLTILAARAAGGEPQAVVAGAAAVELIHDFSLIHDDIMDGDEQRRGRPTLWRVYGVPAAIMVGDALSALAFETLLAGGGPRGASAAHVLGVALRELVSGQARDLQYAHRPWLGAEAVSVAEYQAMAISKTGTLLACALGIGADLAGADRTVVDSFGRVGRHLGLAFQCVDDILGIWGEQEVTGKPILGDLREGKKTLPIVMALAAGTPASEELAGLLDRAPSAEDDLRRAARLIDEAGGRAFAEREAGREIDRARELLRDIPMPPEIRSEFDALAVSLLHRVR